MGDQGHAGRAPGRAGDAPGTRRRRSEDAPGEPRAPQERPGTLRERSRDAPGTLRRRLVTQSCSRTLAKTPADRFSSVFRTTRNQAEVDSVLVFTVQKADRAFCATATLQWHRGTKNEAFRPTKTTPGTSRKPQERPRRSAGARRTCPSALQSEKKGPGERWDVLSRPLEGRSEAGAPKPRLELLLGISIPIYLYS